MREKQQPIETPQSRALLESLLEKHFQNPTNYTLREILQFSKTTTLDDFEQKSFFENLIPQLTLEREKAKLKIQNEILSYEPKTLDDLFEHIHSEVTKLVPTNNFYISLYDSINDSVSFPFMIDENISQIHSKYSLEELKGGSMYYVMKKGTPVLLSSDDVTKLANLGEFKIVNTLSEIYLAVPLLHNKEVVGVVALQDYKNSTALTQDDLETLTSLAHSIGNAIKRKQVDISLNNSEEKFRSLVDSSLDAIVSIDDDGKIISWNGSAIEIFGYQKKEILGQSVTVLMPERYRKGHLKGILRFQETQEKKIIGTTVQVDGQRKNGSIFPIELSLYNWSTSNETVYTAAIRDITERKQAKEELENRTTDLAAANLFLEEESKENKKLTSELNIVNEELRQTNESLTKTLYQIAHDIKNPLGSIMGSSEMIESNLLELQGNINEKYNGLLEENLEFATLITDASTRLTESIDTMLTTSKNLVPTCSNEDLYMLTQYVISVQQIVANERNLEIISNIPKNTRVYVDPKLVQTALTNLISNSLKFTFKGGVYLDLVEDNVKYIKTNNTSKESYVTLRIRDTGIGMPEDKLAKFLTEGKQASPSSDITGRIGTGIGSLAVKNAINKNNAFFDGSSKVGEGCTWYVTLPSKSP